MHRLSFLIVWLMSSIAALGQSPHGEQLQIDCAHCHTSEGWNTLRDSMKFDHKTTEFILENSHATVDCKSCHTSLIFDEASSDCFSCHTDVHSMSVGNECASCHSTTNWLVDHIPELHEQNGFPLVGAHAVTSCIDCHFSINELKFDRIGNECANCHMDEYSATQNPNHTTVGFSTDCIECHDPFAIDWNSDNINHSFFPLELGHDIGNCLACHEPNNFSTASPICSSCHLDDFNGTTNPNHTTLGFSNDCAECHTIAGWSPSNFDHSSHPLNGAHALIATDCNACHKGDYSNTPNTCFGCHSDDYSGTTNPNHQTSGFSTNCAECHTETSWKPSTFDHDAMYFPIYSGKHRDEWSSCTDCHKDPANYSSFTCIACHEHSNKNDLDDDHQGVSGYIYSATSCFDCHPTGED